MLHLEALSAPLYTSNTVNIAQRLKLRVQNGKDTNIDPERKLGRILCASGYRIAFESALNVQP